MLSSTSPVAGTQWLQDNWGNLASLAGLLISVWVLIVSTKAKSAVIQLRVTLGRRSLAQELRDCGEDVSLLNVLTDAEKWDLAATGCYRIIQKLSFLERRWSTHVDDDTRKSLNLISTQLQTATSQYKKFKKKAPSPMELRSLEDAILRVNTLLSAEVGKYERRADDVGGR